MHRVELPEFEGESWLNDLINHAVTTQVCVRWGCTTCGAKAFRTALRESGNGEFTAIRDDNLDEIVRQLRALLATPEQLLAIRFVLMVIYSELGPVKFNSSIPDALVGSPCHDVYSEMAAHYAALQERRREHDLRNDPEEIARRKRLRERERQERLRERTERKAEIDQAWRARQAEAKINVDNGRG